MTRRKIRPGRHPRRGLAEEPGRRRRHSGQSVVARGLLIVLQVLAIGVLLGPLLALVVRAPWPDVPAILTRPDVLAALLLSLGTAALSTLACLVLGIPLAILLDRSRSWALVPRRLLRALVAVPLVLPPVVGGVALLLLLGRRGLLGASLDAWWGISIPFTTVAVVVAQTFVALPFLVLAVETALLGRDRRLEAAAETLGATPATVFWRITLPLMAPGAVAGTVLCFARALGEFGATITFAGSLAGVTRTLPVATYLELQSDPNAAIVFALLLMVVAVIVLVSLRDQWTPGLRS